MMVAVVGALAIGAWTEAAAIVFLFSLAEMLESYSVAKTRGSISELMDFSPRTAKVLVGDSEETRDVSDVMIGDIIVIRPGERIAMDGEVVGGTSSVDESPITGESVHVSKDLGDQVFGGSLNTTGSLEVKVTKRFEDTVLSKIVRSVEGAELSKTPTERIVDRFSRYYTPTVIGIALLTMFVPVLFFSQPFEVWFYRGLVLLVISCPCALVISTPVSVVSAISGAAGHGVLFKGGTSLEELGKIDVICFDKTGPLTQGRPKVESIIPLNGHTEREVLKVAASAENRSEHHLARALVEKAKKENIQIEETRSFESYSGMGISVVIQEKRIIAGSPRFFKKMGMDLTPYEEQIERSGTEGRTVILVGAEDELMGIVAIRDSPRPAAKEVVRELRSMGIVVVMLTGDDHLVARRIAEELGIDEYYARLLPDDKVRMIDELRSKYGKVAMVGDGVNDAPALAKADMGIAMGAAGTDIALEAADIALMGDDLHALTYSIRLARLASTVIKQNLAFSLTVKLLLTVLVFPGTVTLWIAILFGDVGVSLGVIGHAMRLHRYHGSSTWIASGR